ncbi:MAG: pyruvate dehydrogenase (acetyl-transferring) E1 component subunit alpha [Gammaproteobacteria bacterium]
MTDNNAVVAQFEIRYHQFLTKEGVLVQPLPEPLDNNPTLWKEMYYHLVRNRMFDEKAIKLQRTGQMSTYPSTEGQEAIAVGVGMAMHREDVLVPYYRECGAHLVRGVKMDEMFMYWGGDERGSLYEQIPNDFPYCVPIATQCLHAAGVAAAFKYKQEKRAAVSFIGDGGTSKGDFYEAMNVAGVWHLPVVFLINNNQWAISVPISQQTACKTLAQKGIAAGLSAEQVDGDDIFAVYHATHLALDRARQGKGAHVIEAITYRMGDHTTADDASRYRDNEAVQKHRDECPILRLRKFMESQNVWNAADESALIEKIAADIEAAVTRYQQLTPCPVTDMFDYLYETLPDALQEQRDEVIAYFGDRS